MNLFLHVVACPSLLSVTFCCQLPFVAHYILLHITLHFIVSYSLMSVTFCYPLLAYIAFVQFIVFIVK